MSKLKTKNIVWNKVFGNKSFLKTFARLFLPAALQSMLSILIIYVDNFSIATLIKDHELANIAKEALGLASPIIDLQVLVVCGWVGGIGIMFSQYFGDQNISQIHKTTCFRLWSSVLFQVPLILIFSLLPGKVIMYVGNLKQTNLSYELARIYLFFSEFTFIPYAISLGLTFCLQETKRAGISFISAFIGVATNLILDPIMISCISNINDVIMLVALSTGIARIIQSIFVILWIYFKKDQTLWFFKSWNINWSEIWKILKNGLSVFFNEAVYAICAMMFSICLLSFNPFIHDATTNLILMVQFTTMIWPGMSAASSVLVGSELGANNIKQAKLNANRLLTWGIIISTSLGLIMFILATFINQILSPAANQQTLILSRNLEWVMSPLIITQGISAIAYNAAKSGGSKLIVFVDGGVSILWLCFVLPITYSTNAININPLLFLFMIESNQIVKMIISFVLFKYTKWAKVLTKKESYDQ